MGDWKQAEPPSTLVKRELCLTNLTYYLDVNVLDDPTDTMAALRRAREEGWVRLQKTDTLDTELSEAKPGRRADLVATSADYAEALGPFVFNHSRFDFAVFASEDDDDRLRRVLAITKPGVTQRGQVRPNDMRDAMHIATASRYAGSGLITRDKNLLRRSAELSVELNGFSVADPEAAVKRVWSEIRLCRRRKERYGHDRWLPDWPSTD